MREDSTIPLKRNQADVTEAFNSICKFLDDSQNTCTDIISFEQMVGKIYCTE